MSKEAAQWMQNHKQRQQRRSDLPKKDDNNPQQERALLLLQTEAKRRGSFLTSGGKGGLPSSLVLGVMRRDKYRCKSCGRKGDDSNGGIGIHHKGGIASSEWLSNKGHSNDPNNLVTICTKCHDREHEEAREDGTDSSQVTPAGDVGNKRRDKGLPPPDL